MWDRIPCLVVVEPIPILSEGDASSDGPADAFGIVGDVINEIGGDLSSDAGDSVALAGLTGIDSVAFERTAIRFEDDEATLRMTTTNEDGTSDVVHIFDHYNEDLPFRQVEQLLLDEGWEDDQIWNLVAGTSDGMVISLRVALIVMFWLVDRVMMF